VSTKIKKLKSETRILMVMCNDHLVEVAVIRGIQGLEHLVLSTIEEFFKDLPNYKFLGEVRYSIIYKCPEDLKKKIEKYVQIVEEDRLENIRYIIAEFRDYLSKILLVAKSFKLHTSRQTTCR